MLSLCGWMSGHSPARLRNRNCLITLGTAAALLLLYASVYTSVPSHDGDVVVAEKLMNDLIR